MSAWSRISRDDLITWANSDGAKELPELVRRLVYETGDGIDAIDMPGGSGIALGGYDGFVRATNGTAFIPHGVSVWELSVRKGAPAKADEDYAKRVEVPDGSPTTQATYIQLICRPWAKAQAWAKDRASDGRWREVRAYDVDVLTTWLEQAPATRLWFLELRGRSPTGVTPASTWWARWSGETEPALAADVVLARSKAGLDGLHAALRRPGVTTISGPMGADELTACTVAAAVGADDDLLSRTLIVHDQATWSRLLADPAPMVLIAGDGSFAKLVDPTTHHTVVIPVSHSAEGDVELDLIDGDVVANALRAADHSLPNELGALARRSLVALRRRLAKQHVVRPTWATAPPSRAVRAATLLVSWDDRSEADRAVLSVLAGMPYEEARERLLALTHGDDPLLALTGSCWHVVSPLDAWLLLGRYLLVDDLTVFVGQATGVLGERDPSLSMPPGDRWRANLDGKVRAYSGAVRKGVVTTLALLGAYGETVGIGSGVHGEVWAARAIRPQLDAANADVAGELWASMADVLPLLIEASPRDVLDAMRKGTTGLNPVLSTIFQDDPDQQSLFGPSSPHTWFLWALERAAWSGEHLAATSELLARLAVLDPGGRLSNRPQASLESIYCGWHPDTAADPAARLVVIDRLRERWPETAWSLLISLLPVSHGIHHPTNDPEFRDWKPHQRAVLLSEYRHLIDAVVGRLLEDVGADVARWNDLLGAHQNLPPDLREGVRETLDSVDLSGLGDDVRRALWNRVRKLAAHHREYADAKWAMSEDELSLLDAIAERIAPADPEHRHAWLFADDWIELGDLRRQDDFAAHRAEVAARRAAAMNEIVSQAGIDALAQFAAEMRPGLVGVALADAFEDTYLDLMLTWLEGGEPQATVAGNYLWRRCRVGGLRWARDVLATCPELTVDVQARLLHDIDDFRNSWQEAQQRGADVERSYWKRFVYVGLGGDFADVLVVAEHLGRVGRWAAALDVMALNSRSNEATGDYGEAIAQAFEGFIEAGGDDPEAPALASWDFKELFQILDANVEAVGLDRITRIQWYFFPVLGFEPPTTTLHRRLADEPAFFVEIVSLVYRPRADVHPGVPPEPDRDPQLAQNAYRLLDSWSVPPGLSSDRQFDPARCEAWITEATQLLASADRLTVGRHHIGQILTYTPGDDNCWPSKAFAAIIEQLDDDDIDRGVQLKIRNRRGVTSRGVTEGGDQERELAVTYRAQSARFIYTAPRVARILGEIAQQYEQEAREHDDNAERRRRGLDS